MGSYEAHGPPFRFPRRAPCLRLSDVAFSHEVCPKCPRRPPCRRHLCGVFSKAGLSPAPLPSRERKKKNLNNCSLVFKRSGGWGLWSGGEARRGLERSRVLQPVGQVELEFRRVGGRGGDEREEEEDSGGARRARRREEPRRPGCGSAQRSHDLEGLPLLAGTGASARGRQCPAPVSRLPL